MDKSKSFIMAGEVGVIVFMILMALVRVESNFAPPGDEGSIFGLLVLVVYFAPVLMIEYGFASLMAGGACIEDGTCDVFPPYAMWVFFIITAFLWGIITYPILRWAVSRIWPDAALSRILSENPGKRTIVAVTALTGVSLVAFFTLV